MSALPSATSTESFLESPELSTLDDAGRALLFTQARTANTFTDEVVSDAQLASIWELAKWPPTASNVQPLRVVFVRTAEGKERLVPNMSEGNRAKTSTAPAVAILAADTQFYEYMPLLFPHKPGQREKFATDPGRSERARFNATLQAGYFLLAVRAHGLAAGPMGGFNGAALDAEFFSDGRFRTILVVNIGHPGENPWRARLPRLDNSITLSWA